MNLAAKPVPVLSASRVTTLEGDTIVTPFAFGWRVLFADGARPSRQHDPTGSQSELLGTTLDHLGSANWDCQQRGPTAITCAPPGAGLPPIPSLGAEGHAQYHLAVFGLNGTPVGSAHFVRADLYHGQTCAFTGQPFVFRAIISHYECFKSADL